MHNPAHPGEVLKVAFLEEMGLSIQKLADHLHMTRASLSRVINGHASMRTELAIKLELAGFSKAKFWLDMQKNYNLWQTKHFGLTIEQEKNPLSSTYIGWLYLKGELTQEQYDAAQKYLQIRNNYLCAKGFLCAIYDEMPSSSDEKERDKWVQLATEQFSSMQKIVREVQCRYKQYNLHSALQYLVVEDQTLPYLVSSLRFALNALQKYFVRKTKC